MLSHRSIPFRIPSMGSLWQRRGFHRCKLLCGSIWPPLEFPAWDADEWWDVQKVADFPTSRAFTFQLSAINDENKSECQWVVNGIWCIPDTELFATRAVGALKVATVAFHGCLQGLSHSGQYHSPKQRFSLVRHLRQRRILVRRKVRTLIRFAISAPPDYCGVATFRTVKSSIWFTPEGWSKACAAGTVSDMTNGQ